MAYEGKRSAGTKKKSKVLLVLLMLLVVIAAAGAAWYFAGHSVPEKVKNSGTEVVMEDDVIATPFGELAYPGMWTDRVAHETVQDGEDVRIVFRSTIEGAGAELFTLCYGTVPEDGYVMGSYGETAVSVVMHTIDPDRYADDALDTLYSLQESVNDLLVRLREDPAFTPA